MSGAKYTGNDGLEPGIINSTILTKSVSQSRILRGVPGGSYLTTMPPRNAMKTAWYKKLFCQGVAIIDNLRKSKIESWEMAQRQARMDHRMEWLSRRAEGSTTEPYAPPPIEQEEDSDDFGGNEPKSGDEE